MNPVALPLAMIVLLPAFALSAWVSLAMSKADEELQSFTTFEAPRLGC